MKTMCSSGSLALVALSFAILAPVSQAAEKPFPEKVTRKVTADLEKQIHDQKIPGLLVAVRVPGEGEYVAALGKSNLTTGRPMNVRDHFRIGSITKTFTANAILQLIEQGKLNKSDPMAKWFPDFPGADKITLDDLLRMRSGIVEGWDADLLKQSYVHPLALINPRTVIQRSARQAARFGRPNQKTEYRDVNYTILGEILAKASGKDVAECINDSVVQPLGLKETLYPVDSKLPGELRGYGWEAEGRRFDDKTLLNPANSGAAGAMVSTVADLQIYARQLYQGKLLKLATHKARLETRPLEKSSAEYGEGIIKAGPFWGHTGGINGFQCHMWYLPEKDATIIIVMNRCDADIGQTSTFGADLLPTVVKAFFPEALKALTSKPKSK